MISSEQAHRFTQEQRMNQALKTVLKYVNRDMDKGMSCSVLYDHELGELTVDEQEQVVKFLEERKFDVTHDRGQETLTIDWHDHSSYIPDTIDDFPQDYQFESVQELDADQAYHATLKACYVAIELGIKQSIERGRFDFNYVITSPMLVTYEIKDRLEELGFDLQVKKTAVARYLIIRWEK